MNAPAPLSRAERALRAVLVVNGLITLTALVAVFMPVGWMGAAHARLGMGPAPAASPIFEYLARTVSALYAVHGGLCLLLATDVRRYGPIISYLGWVAVAFAGVVLWVDRVAGMPGWWVAIEAPTVAAMGAVVLFLRWRARG